MKFFSRPALLKVLTVGCLIVGHEALASVVRMDISIGEQPAEPVYINLFDLDAPATIANFLNYVESISGVRRYDGTIFHRSNKDGINIIQGGGFFCDEPTGTSSCPSVGSIVSDDPIPNEYDASLNTNRRGTIAMARTADLASATSQWFFNVDDNAAALPDFAVFGEVLGNGMETIDAISLLPTEALRNDLTEVPVVNYTFPATVETSNLVIVTRIIKDPPARIYSTSVLDFDLVTQGGSTQLVVTVANIGGGDLTIGSVADFDSIAAPFSVVNDGCSAVTLAPVESCDIVIEFSPGVSGEVTDSFNIPSSDAQEPNVTVALRGLGAFPIPTLEVSPGGGMDFGDASLGITVSRSVLVRNIGNGGLGIDSLAVSGVDELEFALLSDNCSGATLLYSESCVVDVQLVAASLGAKVAELAVTAGAGAQWISVALTGNVTPSTASLVLPAVETIELGDTLVGEELSIDVPFGNQGAEALVFYSVSVEGANKDDFTVNSDCQFLTPEDRVCSVTIILNSAEAGSKNAELVLTTNDPILPLVRIPVTASVSGDRDGIPDSIESGAPNNGDGNGDGVADSLQENVISMLSANGGYVTLEAEAGVKITQMSLDPNPSPANSPTANGQSLSFEHGFFSFVLEGVAVGGQASVTIHLHQGQSPAAYFKYGVEPDPTPGALLSIIPHWMQFPYDSAANLGAEVIGNRVVLHFIDGERGDNDLTPNGRIVDPGGPASIQLAGGSSSGGGGGCSLEAAVSSRESRPVEMVLMLGVLLFYGFCRVSSVILNR